MSGINDEVAIIDIEASGLGPDCYPIELGWALPDRKAHGSVLIRPASPWYARPWDPAAERLHGITRDTLDAHGVAPERALETFLQAVAGRRWLLSDGLSTDRTWLEQLFAAAGRRDFRVNMLGQGVGPGFRLIDLDGVLLGYTTSKRLATLRARWREADPVVPHRAGPDAARLSELLRRVQRGR